MKNDEVKYYVSPERLEKYRKLFPELFAEVSRAAELICESEDNLEYLGVLIDGLCGGIPQDFVFCEEENIPLNYAPMFALLTLLEECEEEIKRRNFDDETVTKIYAKFEAILKENKEKFGFYGYSKALYFWGKHYLKPDIFKIGTLQYEIKKYDRDDIYRDENGCLVPLRNASVQNGVCIGTSIKRGGADGETVSFKGEPALLKGDGVISVHIPAKADITEETCRKNNKTALEFFARYYPEYSIKAFMCYSWLMDPQLPELLKPDSNILSFQKFFSPTLHTSSSGDEAIYFVFGKRPKKLEELPETTTLTRSLKKRYLENNPVYAHLGIHFLEK